MTSIAIAVSDTTVTPECFRDAVADGRVRLYLARENGTYRRVQYLAPGTDARSLAEWLREEKEGGATMRKLAGLIHQSVPQVRRTLNALALAEEVEEADQEEIVEWLALAVA